MSDLNGHMACNHMRIINPLHYRYANAPISSGLPARVIAPIKKHHAGRSSVVALVAVGLSVLRSNLFSLLTFY